MSSFASNLLLSSKIMGFCVRNVSKFLFIFVFVVIIGPIFQKFDPNFGPEVHNLDQKPIS